MKEKKLYLNDRHSLKMYSWLLVLMYHHHQYILFFVTNQHKEVNNWEVE